MSGTQAASLKRRRERVEHYSPRAEQHLARISNEKRLLRADAIETFITRKRQRLNRLPHKEEIIAIRDEAQSKRP